MDTHVYQLLHSSANGNCAIKCRVKAPKYFLINFYCYTTHDIYVLYSAAKIRTFYDTYKFFCKFFGKMCGN